MKPERLIFAIRHNGVDYYPDCCLDPGLEFGPRKDLRAILSVLKEKKDDWRIAYWFASVNSFLGGKRPQDELARQPDKVLDAARDEIDGVRHGWDGGDYSIAALTRPTEQSDRQKARRSTASTTTFIGMTGQSRPGERQIQSDLRSNGRPVPTLCGGNTFECAAMETVFHDVPFCAGLKTYDKTKLDAKLHSEISPDRDLLLADLSNTALRKLGISRSQLIDTEKDRYSKPRPRDMP